MVLVVKLALAVTAVSAAMTASGSSDEVVAAGDCPLARSVAET